MQASAALTASTRLGLASTGCAEVSSNSSTHRVNAQSPGMSASSGVVPAPHFTEERHAQPKTAARSMTANGSGKARPMSIKRTPRAPTVAATVVSVFLGMAPMDHGVRTAQARVGEEVAARYELGTDRTSADCRRRGAGKYRCTWSTDYFEFVGDRCSYYGEADAERTGSFWYVRLYDIEDICF